MGSIRGDLQPLFVMPPPPLDEDCDDIFNSDESSWGLLSLSCFGIIMGLWFFGWFLNFSSNLKFLSFLIIWESDLFRGLNQRRFVWFLVFTVVKLSGLDLTRPFLLNQVPSLSKALRLSAFYFFSLSTCVYVYKAVVIYWKYIFSHWLEEVITRKCY